MPTAMNPPTGDGVVYVEDGSVERFAAAGWREAEKPKRSTQRKADDTDEK